MQIKRMTLLVLLLTLLLSGCQDNSGNGPVVIPGSGSTQEGIGSPLAAWTEGELDIHFINTTTGECSFLILPDGTQMLIDVAGNIVATGKVGSTTNSGIRSRWDPMTDPSFRPGKYIADYIGKCMEWTGNKTIDYLLISHFHNDHFGDTENMPVSSLSSTYVLQSTAEILDTYPVGLFMDRGYPDYNYPFNMQTGAGNAANVKNYVTAVKWHVANRGLKAEMFRPGSSDQIHLTRKPSSYTDFKVQNIAVNGEIWDGATGTVKTFPERSEIDITKEADYSNSSNCPEENHCSCVLKLSYGKFDFFAGGDAQYDGMSSKTWKDMETPVAKAAGIVDVMKADHHGVTNTNGYGFTSSVTGKKAEAMSYLQPTCWVICSWTDGHPRQPVYEGVSSLLPSTDIYITNTCSAMEQYKNFSQVRGSDGHIVVRVAKGGASYRVYTLSDSDGKMTVKSVSREYKSK